MKALLVLCILCSAALLLRAAPQSLKWVELFQARGQGGGGAVPFAKGVGGIVTNCSKPGDEAKIINVTITPDPPKKGDNVEIKATFTLLEDVEQGSLIKVYLFLGSLPIFDGEVEDLCDLAPMVGLNCPIPKGPHTIDITENIPEFVPSGEYTGNATATDQNNKELGCLAVKLTL